MAEVAQTLNPSASKTSINSLNECMVFTKRLIFSSEMYPLIKESSPNLNGTLTNSIFLKTGLGFDSITFAISNLTAFEPMSMAANFMICVHELSYFFAFTKVFK